MRWLVWLFVGFGAASAAAEPIADDAPLAIGAIVYAGDTDWGREVTRGLHAGAREANATMELREHQFELEREAAFVAEFIRLGVDAIVLPTLTEAESVTALREAAEVGISIVCYNTCLTGHDAKRWIASFVEADQFEIGYVAGEYTAQWIAESLDRPARVGIVQCEPIEACFRRGRGFRLALGDQAVPWLEMVNRSGLTTREAYDVVRGMLDEFPDLDVIWADNGENTLGAVRAVRDRRARTRVFGTELGATSLEMLQDDDGVLMAVSSMGPFQLGRRAVLAAAAAARGREVVPHQVLPVRFITREDDQVLEQFREALARDGGTPR